MLGVGRHDRRLTSVHDPRVVSDHHLHLTLDDMPHLLVRVAVQVHPGARLDLVIGEGHVLGMKETAQPSGPRLLDRELTGFDEGHRIDLPRVRTEFTDSSTYL